MYALPSLINLCILVTGLFISAIMFSLLKEAKIIFSHVYFVNNTNKSYKTNLKN